MISGCKRSLTQGCYTWSLNQDWDGWQAHTRPVETGVIEFVTKSTTTLLVDFGFRGRSLKGAEAAEKESQWLWLRHSQTDYMGS